MLKRILGFLVIAIAAFAGYVAMQPSDLRITRSASIAAPPEVVFGHINDLRKFQVWSPWSKRDPTMKSSYSGSATGKGAVYSWSGNDEVGTGRMTIMDSKPGKAVRIRLDFEKPFTNTAYTDFALEPDGDKTKVTWSFDGRNGFLEKAIFTVMRLDMDKMIGDDYAKGLASLKAVAEGAKG